MPELTGYLSGFAFWTELKENEKKFLHDNAAIRSYSAGDFVFDSNSECLGMVHLISGSIRVYIMSEEGREVTLFRLEAGDSCVLSASCVITALDFVSYMAAESETRLLIINAGALEKTARENIYLRCYIYELATKRFSSAMQSMHRLLFSSIDGRLAAFLVAEFERTGRREIRMTHEKIAQNISSAREVVARTLKRFSAEGMVEVQRGSITLLDLKKLRSMV
ncbi:MAG: Crp/Fnr family transcriptional regulator [Oscillospiraceae bacterium]|nr:Crp/Fnr family transcriptional regulator [Oscillospiraceae bacterium]